MSAILHAVIVVLLIGLGDSLNPTTLGPAMYLVTIDHPRRRLSEFMAGVFAVNLLGGLVIMLGPGQLLLSLVPKPDPTTKHIIELVAGAALIVIAVLLWSGRQALGRRKPPVFKGNRRSGVWLGAGIAAVELPTALPYFAAIAVIVGSDAAIPGQVAALLVYNAAFLAPIGAMLVDTADPRGCRQTASGSSEPLGTGTLANRAGRLGVADRGVHFSTGFGRTLEPVTPHPVWMRRCHW